MAVDVLLLNDLHSEEGYIRSIGPYRLASELRSHGFSVQVLDQIGYMLVADFPLALRLLGNLVGENTLFVGVSTTFLNVTSFARSQVTSSRRDESIYDRLMLALGHVKLLNKKTKIVFGGPNTYHYKERCDIKIIGYADSQVVKLANELRERRYLPVKLVNGVDMRDNDQVASGFDFASSRTDWHEADCILPGEILPIEVARGCIFKCKFCSYPLNGKNKLDYWRSFDSLRQELIRNYEKFGTTRYTIGDDTFNDAPEKVLAISEVLKSLPFKVRFVCYLRLDLLVARPHVAELLPDMGLEYAYFGVETLNKRTGEVIGKGMGKDRVLAALSWVHSLWKGRVKIHASFIAGLPHESRESIQDTVATVKALDELYSVSWLPLTIDTDKTKPFRSDIDIDPQRFGYTIPPDQQDARRVMWRNEHMDYAEATTLARWADTEMASANKSRYAAFIHYAVLNVGIPEDVLALRKHADIAPMLPSARREYYERYKRLLLGRIGA